MEAKEVREAKNIDGILSNTAQTNEVQKKEIPKTEPVNDPEPLPEAAQKKEDTLQDPYAQPVEKTEVATKSQESPIDEYGNPIEKARVYTEEEVNRMMRDRNARSKWAQEQKVKEQQIQQPPPVQVNEDEPWDVTLQKYVDNAIEHKQKQYQEQQWKAQQDQLQVEFEEKFTNGMRKYSDFDQVVRGKNIPDSVLMATRHLDNPAAFVYAAVKMHPQEIERISKIPDRYIQAAEVGRLHERMVKSKNVVSNAPKPVELQKGDMPVKFSNMPSLEERIRQHALSKRK